MNAVCPGTVSGTAFPGKCEVANDGNESGKQAPLGRQKGKGKRQNGTASNCHPSSELPSAISSAPQPRGHAASTAIRTAMGPMSKIQAEFFRERSQAGLPSSTSWQQPHFLGEPLAGSLQRGQLAYKKSKNPTPKTRIRTRRRRVVRASRAVSMHGCGAVCASVRSGIGSCFSVGRTRVINGRGSGRCSEARHGAAVVDIGAFASGLEGIRAPSRSLSVGKLSLKTEVEGFKKLKG
jgi:hypothetical protein